MGSQIMQTMPTVSILACVCLCVRACVCVLKMLIPFLLLCWYSLHMETSHHANSFNSLSEILHMFPFIYVKGGKSLLNYLLSSEVYVLYPHIYLNSCHNGGNIAMCSFIYAICLETAFSSER
jgi:hypothetical protein